MAILPGTIALGKFRTLYEEEPQRSGVDHGRDLVQQRAIIRLNEDPVRVAEQEDYTVYCNDDHFKQQAGRGPSPLQYFVAAIGFYMFSQLQRLAKKARVLLDDTEMDLSMTYDLKGSFSIDHWARSAQGISYALYQTESPVEAVIQLMQAADKGCHVVNSLRKRMAVAGRFLLDGREYQITD
jgi:uncharacterized OsmC-like protein